SCRKIKLIREPDAECCSEYTDYPTDPQSSGNTGGQEHAAHRRDNEKRENEEHPRDLDRARNHKPKGSVKQKVPPAHVNVLPKGSFGLAGDHEQLPPKAQMNGADDGIDADNLDNLMPIDEEQVSDEERF